MGPKPVDGAVTRDDLEAFADGMLPPQRHQIVADYLAANPSAAKWVAEIAGWNQALRNSAADRPDAIPEPLLTVARALAEKLRSRDRGT